MDANHACMHWCSTCMQQRTNEDALQAQGLRYLGVHDLLAASTSNVSGAVAQREAWKGRGMLCMHWL